MFQSNVAEDLQLCPKRQSETTGSAEASGEALDLLVEQPKTGASLGEILGEGNIIDFIQ